MPLGPVNPDLAQVKCPRPSWPTIGRRTRSVDASQLDVSRELFFKNKEGVAESNRRVTQTCWYVH